MSTVSLNSEGLDVLHLYGAKCPKKSPLCQPYPLGFFLPSSCLLAWSVRPVKRLCLCAVLWPAKLSTGPRSDALPNRLASDVSEAREALAMDEVRQSEAASADPLDAIEADFLAAESTGRLAQAVRQTVQTHRSRAVAAA